MDYTTIAVSIVSGVLSIGAVAAFMAKYMPAITKWAMVAKDAVETLADVSAALAKGPITADELAKLQADVTKFKIDLAK